VHAVPGSAERLAHKLRAVRSQDTTRSCASA
jgi:hypothetical protein